MTNWKIEGLQGVGNVELSLDDSKRAFVLFGSNGVGKTKTLEALLYYFFLSSGNIMMARNKSFLIFPNADRIGQNLVISYNLDASDVSTISMQIDYSCELSQRIGASHQMILSVDKTSEYFLVYLGAESRSQIRNPRSVERVGSFSERQDRFIKAFEIALAEVELKNLGMSEAVSEWFVARAQTINPYQKQDDSLQVEINTVLNALHLIDESIATTMSIDGAQNVYLTIDGEERKLTELSSGFASLIKIIQSIVSAYGAFVSGSDILHAKGVVLIDEIDSHLHVEWQVKIVPTLKKLFPNTTFYITTHSPLVLSQLEEGEAYLLKRDEADGVVRSSVIPAPSNRILDDVLIDAFDIDLNQLKIDALKQTNQSDSKRKLLDLLNAAPQREAK